MKKIAQKKVIIIPLFIGVIAFTILFLATTSYDKKRIDKIADETLAFMEERVNQFDQYDRIRSESGEDGGITLESIFSGYSFVNDGIVVVTDGKKILSTNYAGLNGKNVESFAASQLLPSTHGQLIRFERDNSKWFGKVEETDKYYLCVLYKEKSVFSTRRAAMVYGFIIYGLLWMMLALLRARYARLNMVQMQKQLDIVQAISKMYSVNMYINLKNDSWELIKDSEKLQKSLEGKEYVGEMFETFIEREMAPEDYAQCRDFLNLEYIREHLKNNKVISCTAKHQNGKWILMILVPQKYDERGDIESFLLLCRDVTGEKEREIQYQKELEESVKKAERANAAKTDFLRRMSHDIRTPINGIRGMVPMCKKYMGNEEKQEECLDKIMSASSFLLDLVNDVLDMSKLESGRLIMEAKPFSLTQVVDEVKNMIEIQAQEKNVEFVLESEMFEQDELIGSSLHLRQIMQNIASNAVKYNREGGYVRVSCWEEKTGSEEVCFHFVCEDNGIGMSKEFQESAFEPFSQERESARTLYAGTGLGLAITKHLVDRMNGEIRFKSEKDKGTTFDIRIPLRVNRIPISRQTKSKNDTLRRKIRVLLVEDNDLNMEIAEFMLQDLGAEVKKAWNGQEAVDRFFASEPGEYDVILMDIMMPVLNGLDAAKKIRRLEREDAKTTPIIAMSANAFSEDIASSLEAGMNAHISKPINTDKLIKMLNQYCRR